MTTQETAWGEKNASGKLIPGESHAKSAMNIRHVTKMSRECLVNVKWKLSEDRKSVV
jgi:hypothetical protein